MARMLWLVTLPLMPAKEHILHNFVSSVFLPTGVLLYHGLVPPSVALSIGFTKNTSFLMTSWGSLLRYRSRMWSGQRSPASGHANSGTVLLATCNFLKVPLLVLETSSVYTYLSGLVLVLVVGAFVFVKS